MADNLDEKVSALVDGELPREEVDSLLEGLKRDKAKQMCWQHYHLISDALKNNLPDNIPNDFVNRISLALEAEPLLYSPPRRNFKVQPFLRPAVGFALAASVAAVAFIGLGWNTQTGIEQMPSLALNTTSTSTSTPIPASSTTPITTASAEPAISYTKVHGRQWDVERPDVASKLDDYLINHDQYSASAGMNHGVLPQVSFVGYERSETVPQNSALNNGR